MVYKRIHDLDLEALMVDRFPAFEETSPRNQSEVIKKYKRFSRVNLELFNNGNGLCFINKYLDCDTLKLYDHDKKRINTILIPYIYDSNAQCPLWLTTINEILEGDNNKIRILQDFFGYCLTRDTRYEKAMFLVGEGGTGKSVILDCLQYILGVKNISYISLKYFGEPSYMASIDGKLANVCTEVSKNVEDYEEIFRKVVTGEIIQVSPKFVPQYDIRPFAKLIFAVNQWPHINDQTSAFYRRMLILPLERIFREDEYNRDLKENLKAETPGILNWALEGLVRLRLQKGFYVTESMKEEIDNIRITNNPIAEWARENVRVKPGSEITKPEAYTNYRIWAAANGYKLFGAAKFGIELYRIFKLHTKKDHRQASGNRTRTWPGLAWATPGIGEQQEVKEWED